jgi:hypothetical protein
LFGFFFKGRSIMSKFSDLIGSSVGRNLDANKIVAMRRAFLTQAGLVAGAAVVGGGLLGGRRAYGAAATYEDPNSKGKEVEHKASTTDILNFALNLEYLEANFYSLAVNGTPIGAADTTGIVSKTAGDEPGKKEVGTPGNVSGGSAVPFQVPIIKQLAADLYSDEIAHVRLLRSALGAAAVAQPEIDLVNSFTAAALAAGVITSGQTFSPYANDDAFLLGAFIFEDVGATAYHGAAKYVSAAVLPTAAGILGTEAYHAGAIRALLIQRGQTTASDLTIANAITTLRDNADVSAGGQGDESPLVDASGHGVFAANDGNALIYARTFDEVLKIVYLGGDYGVGGGFFPKGLNGAIA